MEIMTQVDFPSDIEMSIKESDDEKDKTDQDKLLGNKRKSSNSFENNELGNNTKDEKERNDININNQKKKKHADKSHRKDQPGA